MDVSDEALRIAKKNAVLNKVDINFIHQDILKTNKNTRYWDWKWMYRYFLKKTASKLKNKCYVCF